MTVVPVKEAKDTSFKEAIFIACIEAMENDSIPQVTVSWNVVLSSEFLSLNVQYPIDNELTKELSRKRKETFSKVIFRVGIDITEKFFTQIYFPLS